MKRTFIPAGINAAVQTALDAKTPLLPALKTGYYLYTASPHATSTSATHGTGVLRLVPWIVHRAITITRIGAEVTSAGDAGSKVRLGIYADDGTCYPGALIIDAGQIAGDSATVQELTISQALSAGLYWIGGVVQSVTTTQPTLRTVNAPPAVPLVVSTSIPSSNGTTVGFQHTSVTAGLPTPFTASPGGIGAAVRTFVKA